MAQVPGKRRRANTVTEETLRQELAALQKENKELKEQVRRLEEGQGVRRSTASQIVFHSGAPEQQDIKKPNKFERLLGLVPTTKEGWLETRKIMGVCEPKDALKTFWNLIACRETRKTTPETQDASTEDALESYKSFVKGLRGTKPAAQLYNFATLLFVCLCRVRLEDVPVEEVDRDMKEVFGKLKMGTLSTYRSAVLWPVQAVNRLDKHLRRRGDEFFFLYGAPIASYGAIRTSGSPDEFADSFDPPSFNGDENHACFSLPFMTTAILWPVKGTHAIYKVNTALGTKLDATEYDQNLKRIVEMSERHGVVIPSTWSPGPLTALADAASREEPFVAGGNADAMLASPIGVGKDPIDRKNSDDTSRHWEAPGVGSPNGDEGLFGNMESALLRNEDHLGFGGL